MPREETVCAGIDPPIRGKDLVCCIIKLHCVSRRRSGKLVSNRPNNQSRHEAVKGMADQMASKVSQLIKDNRKTGRSYRFIAEQLNALDVDTAKGGKWYASTVRNYDMRSM
jgi:hypothetical protein